MEEVVSVVILRTLKVGVVLDHSPWMELEMSALKQILFCSRWWNFGLKKTTLGGWRRFCKCYLFFNVVIQKRPAGEGLAEDF